MMICPVAVGATILVLSGGFIAPSNAETIRCTNTSTLHSALLNVAPGDEIVLAPGLYYDEDGVSGTASHFPATIDGSPDQRITLRGEDPNNLPLLSGSDAGSRTVLRVFGDYWTVKDLAVTNGQKGIIFDNANYGRIENCHVYGIGYEGIHIRDGSDNCIVEECRVHDTGIRNKGFGEAIYIGTDRGSWGRYDPYVWNTTVRNCTLGPNIAAEAFDVKEGAINTLIEFNYVDATGISLQNYADSFVDLKAARTIVRYNSFVRNGAENLRKGIAIIYRGTEYSAYENVIHDNYFFMDGISNIKLVDSYSGSRDIFAFNNVREPSSSADDNYASIVITKCCPPWYTPPNDGNGVCTAPFGLLLDGISNTTAVLDWNAVNSNTTTYLVQYQAYGDTDGTAINVTNGSSSLTLVDLTPSTVYSWSVTSICDGKTSAPASGAAFLTLDDGDDDPPPPPGAFQIYTDGLIGFWNDYSWGGSFEFESLEDSKVGARSIKASYGGYGGINLKHSKGGIDGSNLAYVRFWVKGDSSVNGPGNPILQLRVNSQDHDFEIMNDVWGIYQFPLSMFGSPSTLDAIVLQNRQPGALLCYVDQIEMLAEEETESPTSQPTASISPTKSPDTSAPTSFTNSPSISPVNTAPPTSHPTTPNPTKSPETNQPSQAPTSGPTSSITNGPTDNCILVCSSSAPTASLTTPSPIISSSSTFVIYDEMLSWEDFSYKGTFDAASTQEAHRGMHSYRADLNAWGALNFKTASPGMLLTELDASATPNNVYLQFYVKGAGSVNLRVRINGKMHDTAASSLGQWVQVSLSLNLFYSPLSVFQVEIQNIGSATRLYFDEIELYHNMY